MKRTLTILALFAVAALLAGPAAQAGPFKKDKKKAAEPHKTWRYDRYPDMSFHKGLLQHDGRSGWKLGDLDLVLAEDCVVFGAGGDRLQPGRTATLENLTQTLIDLGRFTEAEQIANHMLGLGRISEIEAFLIDCNLAPEPTA